MISRTCGLRLRSHDFTTLPFKLYNYVFLMTMYSKNIDDKKTMVREIRRISKKNGKLLVIEFHKITSEVGPPVEMRISQEELKGFAKNKNLKTVDNFVLGENFYAYVFEL